MDLAEKCKAAWERSAEVRAEFSSVEALFAYEQALARGLVKGGSSALPKEQLARPAQAPRRASVQAPIQASHGRTSIIGLGYCSIYETLDEVPKGRASALVPGWGYLSPDKGFQGMTQEQLAACLQAHQANRY